MNYMYFYSSLSSNPTYVNSIVIHEIHCWPISCNAYPIHLLPLPLPGSATFLPHLANQITAVYPPFQRTERWVATNCKQGEKIKPKAI